MSSDTAPPKRLRRLFRIEPQQMVAVVLDFADPQFADDAAVGQRIVHSSSLRRPNLALLTARYMVQCSKITMRSCVARLARKTVCLAMVNAPHQPACAHAGASIYGTDA